MEDQDRLVSSGQEAKKRAAGTEGVGQLKPMPTGSMAEPTHCSRFSTPPSRGCEDMGRYEETRGSLLLTLSIFSLSFLPFLFHLPASASSSEALQNLPRL